MTDKPKLDKFKYISAEEDIKVTLEFSAGLDIDEFMTQVQYLALAIGYHPNSVTRGFCNKAEELDPPQEPTDE